MYQITVKPNVSIIELVKWLRGNTVPSLSLKHALEIADKMMVGQTWEPDPSMVGHITSNQWVDVNRKYDFWDLKIPEKDNSYDELCKRGANGDAEAAIEYCNLVLMGKIPYCGPCG